MNLKPILFSGPMIRAILDGRKTQTRRWCMDSTFPEPLNELAFCDVRLADDGYLEGRKGPADTFERLVHGQGKAPECAGLLTRCSYGDVGDHLWVRETWRTYQALDHCKPRDIFQGAGIHYDADNKSSVDGGPLYGRGKVRQSIFMPRWASRITLEITGVRVERLQEISANDCIGEGLDEFSLRGEASVYKDYAQKTYDPFEWFSVPKDSYESLWDSINGKRSQWSSNPWVWVLEFKRVTNPEK